MEDKCMQLLCRNNQLQTLIHIKPWVHNKVIMESKRHKTQNSAYYSVPHIMRAEVADILRVMSMTAISLPIYYIF